MWLVAIVAEGRISRYVDEEVSSWGGPNLSWPSLRRRDGLQRRSWLICMCRCIGGQIGHGPLHGCGLLRSLPIVARDHDDRVSAAEIQARRHVQRSRRVRGDGATHHAVHNVPLTRLVFSPQEDGRLHRCAINAIEAGNNVASGGKQSKGEHGNTPVINWIGDSIAGGNEAQEGAA